MHRTRGLKFICRVPDGLGLIQPWGSHWAYSTCAWHTDGITVMWLRSAESIKVMRDNGFPSTCVCFPHLTTTDANNSTKTKRLQRNLMSSRNARSNLPSSNNEFVVFSKPRSPPKSPPNYFLHAGQKR